MLAELRATAKKWLLHRNKHKRRVEGEVVNVTCHHEECVFVMCRPNLVETDTGGCSSKHRAVVEITIDTKVMNCLWGGESCSCAINDNSRQEK